MARLAGHPRLVLASILLVALGVRLLVVAATPGYVPFSDTADYDRHARSIAAGEGYPTSYIVPGSEENAFRPPLYPYLLGGVYSVTANSQTAGRLTGALLGVAAVLLIYLIASLLWGRRTAVVAGTIAAAFPPLAFLNAALLTEQPFVVLMLSAVYATLRFTRKEGGMRWAALAGLCCGLVALTRSNGLVMILPVAAGLLAARRPLGTRSLVAPAVAALAAVLAITPWALRNYVVFDSFVPITTQSGFGLGGIYNDRAMERLGYRALWGHPARTQEYGSIYLRAGLDEAEIDQEVRRLALRYAREHPSYVLESAVLNTLRSFELAKSPRALLDADQQLLGVSDRAWALERWSFFLAAMLAVAGIVALASRPLHERGPWWMWLAPVLLVLAGTVILGLTRYRVPIYPFAVLLAAVALVDLSSRIARRRGARPLASRV